MSDVRSIMKWAGMDQSLADGSYDMAVSSWSSNGVASSQGLQIAMEEIRTEIKLDTPPDPAKAFYLDSYRNRRTKSNSQKPATSLAASFFAATL